MATRIVDNMPSFRRSAHSHIANSLREAGKEVLIESRTNAPFKKGDLRRNSELKMITPLHQRVSYWMEYARFQEFGGDSKKRVRRYSTPETGAHYLRNAGDTVADRFNYLVAKHAKRAR